ncbi:hypothetical protein EF53_151 [Enterococcus phage 53]|uniref:hypothetical protein n=1 Tax=Enterococcus phage 53 TaxID=3028143 RepID=UPI004034394C|nr:hypothetical protein EF53_151 [Enterococcus phage 53]
MTPPRGFLTVLLGWGYLPTPTLGYLFFLGKLFFIYLESQHPTYKVNIRAHPRAPIWAHLNTPI